MSMTLETVQSETRAFIAARPFFAASNVIADNGFSATARADELQLRGFCVSVLPVLDFTKRTDGHKTVSLNASIYVLAQVNANAAVTIYDVIANVARALIGQNFTNPAERYTSGETLAELDNTSDAGVMAAHMYFNKTVVL